MSNVEPTEDDAIVTVVVRLNAVTTGVVAGLFAGAILLLATLWLVIKGGPQVGPHLGLLSQYLPGYSVSVAGGFVGLAYGLVLGFVSGYLIGAVYNLMVRR
jgi:hypothetical protein